MLVQLNHHPTSILIVDLHERKGSVSNIDCTFYLASVKTVSVNDDEQPSDDKDSNPENYMPKPYLKVLLLSCSGTMHISGKFFL